LVLLHPFFVFRQGGQSLHFAGFETDQLEEGVLVGEVRVEPFFEGAVVLLDKSVYFFLSFSASLSNSPRTFFTEALLYFPKRGFAGEFPG
jgi:hypothetical protein